MDKHESVVSFLFSQIDSTACHELGIHITKEELHEMLEKGYSSFEQKLKNKDLKILGAGVYGSVYASQTPFSLGDKKNIHRPDEYVIKQFRTESVKKIWVDPSMTLRQIMNMEDENMNIEIVKTLNKIKSINKPVNKTMLLMPSSEEATTPCLLGKKGASTLNSNQVLGTLSGKPLKFSTKDYICTNDFPIEAMIGSYITQVIKSPFFVPALSFTVCYSGKNSTINNFMFLGRATGTLDNLDLKTEKEIKDTVFMVLFALAQFQEHGFNHMDTKLDNIFYKDVKDLQLNDLRLKKIPERTWSLKTDRLMMIGDYGLSCRYFPYRIGIEYSFLNDFSDYFPKVVPNEFSSSYDSLFFLNNMYDAYPRSTFVRNLLEEALNCRPNQLKGILEKGFIHKRPRHRITLQTERTADPTNLLNTFF